MMSVETKCGNCVDMKESRGRNVHRLRQSRTNATNRRLTTWYWKKNPKGRLLPREGIYEHCGALLNALQAQNVL